MIPRIATLSALGALGFAAAAADAADRWGGAGHAHITSGAVAHLPQPLRHFFEANRDYIAAQSANEPPGTHYIDIDYYPEFFAGTFPRDYDDLVAIYGVSVVEDNGTGPWTAVDYTQSLTAQMAAATTASSWSSLRPTAGALAHYLADLHNPLHLTMNYNGQLTGNTGIHSRYESSMISRHLPDDLPIVPAPEQCVHFPSILDAIFDSIDVNYWYVDDIMAADDLAVAADPQYRTTYYNVLWANTGAFTQALFQDASEMIASAWYTAWIDAGAPLPLPAPSTVEMCAYCLSGPDVPYPPGCTTTDADSDDDTDLLDAAQLQVSSPGL